MTGPDADFVRSVIAARQLHSPCLELGVGYGGSICKPLVTGAGIAYYGTDVIEAPSVDFVADFEESPEALRKRFEKVGQFGSILILNVLEHCFDPIRVLDHAVELLRPGGTLVLVTPTIWPLHDYPRDCWRINPNFYEEYCKRRGLSLLVEHFEYVGVGPVHRFQDSAGNHRYPAPGQGPLRAFYSKGLHRLFNTYGRGMFFPSHVAIGAVIRK